MVSPEHPPPPCSFILIYPAPFHFTCSLFLTTSSLNCTFLIINPFHFSNIDNNSCILSPLFLFFFLSRCLSRTRALSLLPLLPHYFFFIKKTWKRHLLPALPPSWAKSGAVTGLRARGGIELTRMAWVKRRLTEIEIKATDRGWDELVRHYPAGFFFWGGGGINVETHCGVPRSSRSRVRGTTVSVLWNSVAGSTSFMLTNMCSILTCVTGNHNGTSPGWACSESVVVTNPRAVQSLLQAAQ